MKEKILKIHRAMKEWITQVLFRKYLTPFALICIYYFVLGPTALVARVFFKKALTRTSQSEESNWIALDNYHENLEDTLKQS